MHVSGIKCDNPGCGYSDPGVKREEYLLYLNKSCPRCSSMLLTQKDYDAVVLLEKIESSFINRLINRIFGYKRIQIDLNGKGLSGAKYKEIKNT